jgi:stage II sporulation protein GA (sporulation sigma-E factor processing peptidase)
MDFIILWLENKICKKHASAIKLLIGALIGAVEMCIIVIMPFKNYLFNLIIGYFISSLSIVYITYRPKRIIELIKLTVLMYIIAIALGGLMFAIYYYTSIGYGMNQIINHEQFDNINIYFFLLIIMISVVIFIIVFKLFQRTATVSKNIFNIKITIKENNIETNALLDTGNNLYDPITNDPVIIGEIGMIKDFLSKSEFEQFKDMINNKYDMTRISSIKEGLDFNIRCIPFSSLGEENGLLLGIVTDKISISTKDGLKEYSNIVIAIYNKKLSNDNSYNVLLHPSFFLE